MGEGGEGKGGGDGEGNGNMLGKGKGNSGEGVGMGWERGIKGNSKGNWKEGGERDFKFLQRVEWTELEGEEMIGGRGEGRERRVVREERVRGRGGEGRRKGRLRREEGERKGRGRGGEREYNGKSKGRGREGEDNGDRNALLIGRISRPQSISYYSVSN